MNPEETEPAETEEDDAPEADAPDDETTMRSKDEILTELADDATIHDRLALEVRIDTRDMLGDLHDLALWGFKHIGTAITDATTIIADAFLHGPESD